ncbi:hypothetical protein C2E23DRAFT_844625 [Lenzites betulinus]|nr:hypothetical protein C2E23DRAFT_844625 [Lenzites betulinus]
MLHLPLPAPTFCTRTRTERPTLPSLASLDLPDIRSLRLQKPSPTAMQSPSPNCAPKLNNEDNLLPPIPLDLNRTWARARVSSISSESSDTSVSSDASMTSMTSTTSMNSATSTSSTTSSFTMSSTGVLQVRSERTMRVMQRHHPYYNPARHRVVLSDRYDDADIMLIMPADPSTMVGTRKQIYDRAKARGSEITQSQFVFGPTAKFFRQERVRDVFPAKVHPYRIISRYPTSLACDFAQPTCQAARSITPPTSEQ